MTAIAFFRRDKYEEAVAIGGDDKMKVIEEYKKISSAWKEGPEKEIEDTRKHAAFYGLSAKKVKEAKKVKKTVKKVAKKKKK